MLKTLKKLNRNAGLIAVGGTTFVGSALAANATASMIIAAKASGTVAYGAAVANTVAFLGMVGGFGAFAVGIVQGSIEGFTSTPEEFQRKLEQKEAELLNLSH